MAVKIRLMRVGKKKQPSYRVVVADERSPRGGRFIEIIGQYDPRQEPTHFEIDSEKALTWLQQGAQPTEKVQRLLADNGLWAEFVKGKKKQPKVKPPKADLKVVAKAKAAEEEAKAKADAEAAAKAAEQEAKAAEEEAKAAAEAPAEDDAAEATTDEAAE